MTNSSTTRKKTSSSPLITTEKEAVEIHALIHCVKISGKPNALKIDRMKDHWTMSNAFDILNLVALLVEMESLW